MSAPIVVEIVGSQANRVNIDSPEVELAFTVFGGTGNDAEYREAIEATLPENWVIESTLFAYPMNLVPQGYEFKQRNTGGLIFDGTAKYGRRLLRQTGDIILAFDGTGGTAHVTVSKETVSQAGLTLVTSIPDFKNAIGVNNDSVEGCDITIPVFKFTLEYFAPTAVVTPEYIIEIMTMTGSTNQDLWKGFPAGTVLFLGPTGQPRSLDDWDITFHFVGSPHADGTSGQNALLNIGDLVAIPKKGHDYLWVRFADIADANVLTKQPQFAFTERVYDPKDFTRLGLGS